ncbi:MAG: hypothetical protein MUF81_02645 [Verrucomicrobia bacterium]|jgi:hypothetical protein|nr:hypothetical protein [Verrucomicrobiota bacterium]
MPSKPRHEPHNHDTPLPDLADYGSSTPELDQCIAEAERERCRIEELLRDLTAAYGKQPSSKAEERDLERKTPTYRPHSQSEPACDPFLSLLGIGPAKSAPPEWMQRLKSVEDRLGELREILWADVKFWKRVANGYSAELLSGYIRDHYGLDFPAWPALVWQQMVHHPQKREKLFGLHRISFDEQRDEDELRDMGKKLPPKLAGDLLWEYLRAPGLRHTHVLASQELEPSTLGYLRKALCKLVDDIKWCQKHPGIVPPRIALNPRNAPKDIVPARGVEKFVQCLLSDPTQTSYDLAKRPVGGTNGARLKWAAQARDLVQSRENAAVKHYSEQRDGHTIGRKPRQSRKASPRR